MKRQTLTASDRRVRMRTEPTLGLTEPTLGLTEPTLGLTEPTLGLTTIPFDMVELIMDHAPSGFTVLPLVSKYFAGHILPRADPLAHRYARSRTMFVHVNVYDVLPKYAYAYITMHELHGNIRHGPCHIRLDKREDKSARLTLNYRFGKLVGRCVLAEYRAGICKRETVGYVCGPIPPHVLITRTLDSIVVRMAGTSLVTGGPVRAKIISSETIPGDCMSGPKSTVDDDITVYSQFAGFNSMTGPAPIIAVMRHIDGAELSIPDLLFSCNYDSDGVITFISVSDDSDDSGMDN